MGYTEYIKEVTGASLQHLGLGPNEMWHGVTEIRIRGCDFVTTMEHQENSDSDSESIVKVINKPPRSISPGNLINIEGKLHMKVM